MLDTLIKEFAPVSYEESHFRYLPDGWRVSTREQSAGAEYFNITRPSIDPDYAAALAAVVCLDLIK